MRSYKVDTGRPMAAGRYELDSTGWIGLPSGPAESVTRRRGETSRPRTLTSLPWPSRLPVPYGPDDAGENAGCVAGGSDCVEEPDAVRDHASRRPCGSLQLGEGLGRLSGPYRIVGCCAQPDKMLKRGA